MSLITDAMWLSIAGGGIYSFYLGTWVEACVVCAVRNVKRMNFVVAFKILRSSNMVVEKEARF